MDCFYAAVEVRDNPSLKGKPVAVGGSSDRRGVLTTANYEARKFGCRSAMPTSTAMRLCPDLILIPVNFSKYRAVSQQVHEIFSQFTENVEGLSLDEAFLDVTNSPHCNNMASDIARAIRAKIFEVTQLTASAGIAQNKFLAKVASDWRKPNGQFTVAPAQVADFVKVLKVEKIPGVGKVTAKKMHELKLFTCADLQTWPVEKLKQHFGSWGPRLYEISRGIDHRPVSDDGERKSISVENTFAKDLTTVDQCLKELPELLNDFNQRLDRIAAHDPAVRQNLKGLVVKLKFYDFKQTTVESAKFKTATLEGFRELLITAFDRGRKDVRLIGIGAKFSAQKKGSTRSPNPNSGSTEDSEQLSLLL